MNKAKLCESLFFVIMGTVYTYAVVLSILEGTILSVPPLTLLVISFAAVMSLNFIFHNRATALVAVSTLLFAAFAMFVNVVFFDGEPEWFIALKDYADDVYSFIRGANPYSDRYIMPIALGAVIAVAIVVTLNIKVRFGFWILSLFGGVIILLPRVMNYAVSEQAGRLYVFCLLVFLAYHLHKRAGNKARSAAFSLLVIPVCAAIVALASFLPKPDYRAGEISPEDAWRDGGDLLYSFFNQSTFLFQSTGFAGKDGRLGGPVVSTGRFVMDVFADERLYLTGAVKSEYTGYSWEEPDAGQELLTENDVTTYSFEHKHNYYGSETQKTARIAFYNARTSSLFMPSSATKNNFPLKVTNIEFNKPVKLLSSAGGVFATDNIMQRNTEYTITYVTSLEMSVYNELDGVDDKYLRVPKSVPERVYQLAREIADSRAVEYPFYGTDINSVSLNTETAELLERFAYRQYQYAAVQGIVEYLNRFPYTLEPEEVPDGADFVDWFLFEGQEGYCTYFASALAIMGRTLGIPTRYVEGYLLPAKPLAHGGYRVTTYQAHAWVEAYIGGAWITFEPTAPFAQTHRTALGGEQEAESAAPSAGTNMAPSMQNSAYADYMRQMGLSDSENDYSQDGSGTQTSAASARPRPMTASERFEAQLAMFKRIIAITFFVCAVVFALALIAVIFRRIKFGGIDKMERNETVIEYYRHILKIAGIFEYTMERTETVNAFAKRLGMRFAFCNQTVYMSHLSAIFGKAAYGAGNITDEELALIKNCYFEFLDMLRMYRCSKPRFLLYKYVLEIKQ